MKNILKFMKLLLLGLVFLAFSCQKDYDKEYNWSYPLSGDWTVSVKVGEDVLGTIFIKTYNTSYGKDSIWVDDNGTLPLKAKAKANMSTLSFETTNFLSYPETTGEHLTTIANAKVINNDSIYFETVFADDPGTTYLISGHRRLSYEEYTGL